MGYNRRRAQKKKQQQVSESRDGISINIPAGQSSPERAQHDEIEIEPRKKALNGAALTYGEVVSTSIRKLLDCGAITHEEAHAANTFKYDHEAAFECRKSSLCSVGMIVDGGGGGDFTRQIFHAQRYTMAKNWLRPNMLKIAEAAILGIVGGHAVTYSFKSLGSDLLPRASEQELFPAGKGALTLVVRELFCFYAELAEKSSKSKPRRRSEDREDSGVASG